MLMRQEGLSASRKKQPRRCKTAQPKPANKLGQDGSAPKVDHTHKQPKSRSPTCDRRNNARAARLTWVQAPVEARNSDKIMLQSLTQV